METSAWNINVTAHSALDFSTSVLETSSVGNSYQLSGNPIKGDFLINVSKESMVFVEIFIPI